MGLGEAGVSAELVAMMLTDARLPTGGLTQSAGLEPAVGAGLAADGRSSDDVPRYCAARLRTVTRVEAGTAVVARHVAASDGDLVSVEVARAARTPSQALRAVSRRQERGYLRLAEWVWPEAMRYLLRDSETARPVVLGVIGAVTDLEAAQVARLVGYDDVQTVVAASLELLPVDPAQAAAWSPVCTRRSNNGRFSCGSHGDRRDPRGRRPAHRCLRPAARGGEDATVPCLKPWAALKALARERFGSGWPDRSAPAGAH